MSPSPSASSRPSSPSVFFGRMARTSSTSWPPVDAPRSCFAAAPALRSSVFPLRGTLTSASRWPSVATRLIDSGYNTKSAPFRKYRVSSPVIANCVFATISFSPLRGSVALGAPPPSGSVGKSSRGSVCIRESNRSAATLTPPLSSAMRMSVSGSDLTIS